MQRQKVPSPESMNYLCLHKVGHGSGSAVGTAQGAARAASWGAPRPLLASYRAGFRMLGSASN